MSPPPQPALAVADVDTHAPKGTAAIATVRGRRIYFVDLLRLLASFQMVHGHTLDALMADELRSGPTFERWSWARGLVSVSFMVAAGFSFHLSTIARFEQHRADPKKVLSRFRRGAWLVALGYLLHFPAGLFGGDAQAAAAAIDSFLIADVLQCIGLCIIALEGLVVLLREPRHVVIAAGVLATLAFGLAPLGDRLDPSGPLRFLTHYLTHRGGSLFPLTPWAGFVMAGVVAAEIALPQGTRTPPEFPIPRLVALSAGALALSVLCDVSPLTWVTEATSRNAEPAFNLQKLGAVLAIVAALALVGRHIERLPKPLTILAGESLMLYAFHLLVLYGAGVGLYRVIGHTLSLPAAIGVAAAMIAVTAAVGLGWFYLKAWRAARPR